MNPTRTQIFDALFALLASLKTAGTLKNTSQILKAWDEWDLVQQPVVTQMQLDTPYVQKKTVPGVRNFKFEWWLYAQRPGDDAAVAAATLNPLMDALEGVLQPGVGEETFTLGGLVSHCWITNVRTDQGNLGTQGVAVFEIEAGQPASV